MENNEAEKDELYEETNYGLITEEVIEHIHPELDHNFPYPTMNSSVMSIHQNDPDNIINYPEDFCQYRC